ncbi:type VI secretion system-associated protein TagF [Terrarubrum flagellatum]|uniref:type VI secretion system-associated protein TagF n=1 Tax=Terrirubrum flagellatum TaxID=2895980 RepID=UPI003144E34F
MKRDFISVDIPREFLQVWEAWLQGGVAASRIVLGTGWRDIFLRAPIWRFWLGPEICGMPVMGSFMASVDGVGRFFPLTAIAYGEKGDAFEPPLADMQEAWFGDVESFLLSALEEGASYDACLETLRALPVPARIPRPAADSAIKEARRALIAEATSVEAVGDAFKTLLAERDRRMYSAASFWWTIGGEEFPPTTLFSEGLPDPNIVTSLLSGQFEAASGN